MAPWPTLLELEAVFACEIAVELLLELDDELFSNLVVALKLLHTHFSVLLNLPR